MEDLIIIISFTYPHEAHLVRGMLESKGIEVQVKDELTTQVINFYSNAIGGVKLLVKKSDYEKAYKILRKAGYLKEQEVVTSKFYVLLDRITSKLPIIGKSSFAVRFFIVAVFALAIIVVPTVLLSLPTKVETLTRNTWCINAIYIEGKEVWPNSPGLKPEVQNNNCSETMNFRNDGNVFFPGVNSYGENGSWTLINDSLTISERLYDNNFTIGDSLHVDNDTVAKSIFIGKFKLEINDGIMALKSDSVTILGRMLKFNNKF